MRGKRLLSALVVLAGGLAAAGWLGRDGLRANLYVWRLLGAGDDALVEQAPAWGDGVPPRLLERLGRDDATACARAGAALGRVAEAWGADDPRTLALWQQCAERYPAFNPPGQA